MITTEYYESKYPYEKLLPELDESEIEEIVSNCDYTFVANQIAINDYPNDPMTKVNTADAVVFYMMGYNAAKKRIDEILEPIILNNDNS